METADGVGPYSGGQSEDGVRSKASERWQSGDGGISRHQSGGQHPLRRSWPRGWPLYLTERNANEAMAVAATAAVVVAAGWGDDTTGTNESV